MPENTLHDEECSKCGRWFRTRKQTLCWECYKNKPELQHKYYLKRKAKKPVPKPKISKLKKKLMELVKAHVKRRDNYTCQWCGRTNLEGSNCHVSHVIPVSQGNALAFEPLNMKVLCFHCHINVWHKHPVKAIAWFGEKFPERYKYLYEHQNDIVHWKAHDYLEMIEKAKEL